MNRPACRAGDHHTTKKPTGFHARPHFQELLQRNPFRSTRRLEIEFSLKTHQRGHEIGGCELRGAKVSSDGGDLTDSGIGGTVGSLSDRLAFRKECKRRRQFCVRDARTNSYLMIENFNISQFVDSRNRHIG
jgi:hypothetical protein